MKKFMHFLARLFPPTAENENPAAVKWFQRMTAVKDFIQRNKHRSRPSSWPTLSGRYQVYHPQGAVAICTLTSDHLYAPFKFASDKVAIAGSLMTPNLGLERMIINILANAHIRYVLVCGKDSPVFKPGQALSCLFRYGIDAQKRIIQATGHYPVLNNLTEQHVNRFLQQVQLIDLNGETQQAVITKTIEQLKVSHETFTLNNMPVPPTVDTFTPLTPGGKRIPLEYDAKGFFVIEVNQTHRQIIVKHYYKDNRPGFIIQGHHPEAMLLALLNKGLVSQMSHAAYLGAELAKADTALRLKLVYQQDKALVMGNTVI